MRNLHVVSHTHWDREWYLTFQQFRLKLVELVDGLLELLNDDPNFLHFMLDGQTIVLEDYLQVRPEKETILREHIQNGRIIIGPWHILPDMFLVGAESHIRNLLLGDQTSRKYGRKMMVGYMPDSFGHIAQMPQILRGFGIEAACVWRGLEDEPSELWWQGADGSRIFLIYLRESYSNGANLPGSDVTPGNTALMQRFAAAIAECGELLAAHSAAQNHLIMLGADHMRPARSTSESIDFADETLPNTHVIHSTLEAYITSLHETLAHQLPLVKGELRSSRRAHLLPGVLSTRINIKQRNTASEILLTRWVEPFTTFAELYAEPYSRRIHHPESIIHQAWRILMENHPHDSICGSVLDQVAAEMMPRFDQVDQIGEELTRQSLQALAASVDTQSGFAECCAAVIVFNPLPFTRTDTISMEINLPEGANSFEIINQNGEIIPYQTSGQGINELINVNLSPVELRSALTLINDGLINGFGISTYQSRREGDTLHVDATLSTSPPNPVVWHSLQAEAKSFLQDPTIQIFHIRGHTADAVKIIFTAPGIPGLGWSAFGIRATTNTPAPAALTWFTRAILPLAGRIVTSPLGQTISTRLQNRLSEKNTERIENEFFVVEVETHGTLALREKSSGRVYRGLNLFVDGSDAGDEYNYSPVRLPLPVTSQNHISQQRLGRINVHRGASRQTLSIHLVLKTGLSLSADRISRSKELVEISIMTEITLNTGLPRVDIHTELVNNARDHRLRVHFPTPYKVDSYFTDSHFDTQRRSIGLPSFDHQTWVEDPRPEAPQRSFCQVSSADGGLTLANRGLPEIEVLTTPTGAEMVLTLLRCVGWLSREDLETRRGHAGPAIQTPSAQMPGKWSFDYALLPHTGKNINPCRELAHGFETPLRGIFKPAGANHQVKLPAKGSFVEITPADMAGRFSLSAVKQAEDGSGWLLRGCNTSDEPIEIRISTLKPFKNAALVNLAEKPIILLNPDPKDGRIAIILNAKEIVTLWMGQ